MNQQNAHWQRISFEFLQYPLVAIKVELLFMVMFKHLKNLVEVRQTLSSKVTWRTLTRNCNHDLSLTLTLSALVA